MKTYLELKVQVANSPCPSPTYQERPDTPSPHKVQESKKGSKNHQANKRQYKERLIEKPFVLSRALATLIPTTAVTTTMASQEH